MSFLSTLTLIAQVASWYGVPYHGRQTASGEIYNMYAYTAAHRWYPFGTKLKVCHRSCVVVRVNDRGPFVNGREIDLSQAAAEAIGLKSQGIGEVTITPIN
jgi:rare lipoprotein A